MSPAIAESAISHLVCPLLLYVLTQFGSYGAEAFVEQHHLFMKVGEESKTI